MSKKERGDENSQTEGERNHAHDDKRKQKHEFDIHRLP